MPAAAGKGGAPTPFVNAFKAPAVGSLQYNTSQQGGALPWVFGTKRVSINVIEGWGFEGAGSGTKGGKGLGSSGGKKGSNATYSVNVALALCEGPVTYTGAPYAFSGANRIWANGAVAGNNKVTLNYYSGADGQATDPVFASSDPNSPVLNYSGTAYVSGTPMQLGATPALPSFQVEVGGSRVGSVGSVYPGDANPAYIITDILTDSEKGAGFPAGNLDSSGTLADYANYCQAAQLAMSVSLDRLQPCSSWVDEIATLTGAAIVCSGALLKVIPYGDLAISGNGATWTPNLTPQYTLGDSDFLGFGDGTDPVTITRADPTRVPNFLPLEYEDASNSYNPAVLAAFDQGLIDQYGERPDSPISAHHFTNATSAQVSAQLQLQRKAYILNTGKFKLGWRYSLLEPMDIVEISDATLGISNLLCRITQIDEDDNGELTISWEEIPGHGAETAEIYTVGTGAGGPLVNLFADPGNANPPIVFEPPATLTGGAVEVWVIASGGANWGGCQVWVSLDGSTYGLAGTVYKGARQGVLTANLPSAGDPDTTDTLSVDLTESEGQLLSGTMTDADDFVTLCYCDGELLSYETATLTSTYKYNLTYLRRGIYGTPIGAHSSGAQFARFGPNDASIFKFNYPASFIGKTISVKLASFNELGDELQELSGLTADSYTLTGAGAVTSTAVPIQFLGVPQNGSAVTRYTFSGPLTLPAGLSGSVCTAGTAATSSTSFTIAKNGTAIGTMTFAASATTATFSFASAVSFAAGDVLTITPNRTDATLANLSGYLVGTS